ncbi:GatB/YqeY domain-containing protein [Rhizosaccharibacter radicis]|uniref:GatB/YqeY domain-containing protein n=1 Tax=Rhizosaccharibacter radicis TaxID=2782605 RepID=A0ABT1W054_9PROT|nr:GatB/YqeY domain-containing protein [Acetobacteraceae bacterium KSS12]
MSQTQPLRQRFTDGLKSSMKAGDSARTSTIRMIIAKMKELDIAARPRGVEQVGDDDLVGMLRGMVKSRAEASALYIQGGRGELAAKEDAEIVVIEEFLPTPMDAAALEAAVDTAIAATGAASVKDMGKVMGALKAAHGAALDLGRANGLVKEKLSNG